jgi:hypothetical protein
MDGSSPNIQNKKMWRLPHTMEESLGTLDDYEAIWLGHGEKTPAYVAVRKGGHMSMDLQGKYPGLKKDIKARGAPKVSFWG